MAYRAQALDVLPEIGDLAREILTDEEIEEVDLVSKKLLGKKTERQWAIGKSIDQVGFHQSRPLMYWTVEMRGLAQEHARLHKISWRLHGHVNQRTDIRNFRKGPNQFIEF